MNLKKMLSVMAAAAIGITSLSLSLVSVSASDITGVVGTPYKAEELGGSSNLDNYFIPDQEDAYTNLGSPFGPYNELVSTYTKMISENEIKTTGSSYSITYNITDAGSYTFYVLTPEYDERFPCIELNDQQIFNGYVKTSESNNITIIDNNGDSRRYSIIHITENLNTGTNKFAFKVNSDNNRCIGVVAAVLIKNTEPAVEHSKDWTNLSGDSTAATVVDGETAGEYILTYPQGTTGSGFSYDLLANMTNAPDDLSAVTTGKIKVSYDLCIPADNKAGENFFIDLSGNQNIPGYGGGNTATYGRFSEYVPWNNIKFVSGQSATDGAGVHNAGTITYDTYVTVTYTADLTNGTFTGTYGENTSGALTGTATEKANALYLNVQPTDKANASNDVVMKIKNITSEYIADPATASGTVAYIGASTDADKGDNAYGYTATIETTATSGYSSCKWTVKYGNDTKTELLNFGGKISGGTDIVCGLIIQTDFIVTPADDFTVNAEFAE